MKLRINGPASLCFATCGLVLAAIALRAWELNDDIHGMLMSIFGKAFSLLPKPDDADLPGLRADGILVLTETKLILVLRALAAFSSLVAIFSAVWARRRGVFSAYYASAAVISFGAVMLVHAGIALMLGLLLIAYVAVISAKTK